MNRLRGLLRHVDQKDRDTAVVDDRMVDRQRRLQCVASQIGERVGDSRNRLGIDADGCAIVVDAEDQRAAVRMVAERHEVLGQSVLVHRELRLQSSSFISWANGVRVSSRLRKAAVTQCFVAMYKYLLI